MSPVCKRASISRSLGRVLAAHKTLACRPGVQAGRFGQEMRARRSKRSRAARRGPTGSSRGEGERRGVSPTCRNACQEVRLFQGMQARRADASTLAQVYNPAMTVNAPMRFPICGYCLPSRLAKPSSRPGQMIGRNGEDRCETVSLAKSASDSNGRRMAPHCSGLIERRHGLFEPCSCRWSGSSCREAAIGRNGRSQSIPSRAGNSGPRNSVRSSPSKEIFGEMAHGRPPR